MADTARSLHIARGTIALGIAFVVIFQLHHVTHMDDDARLLREQSDLAYAGRLIDALTTKSKIMELDLLTGQLVESSSQVVIGASESATQEEAPSSEDTTAEEAVDIERPLFSGATTSDEEEGSPLIAATSLEDETESEHSESDGLEKVKPSNEAVDNVVLNSEQERESTNTDVAAMQSNESPHEESNVDVVPDSDAGASKVENTVETVDTDSREYQATPNGNGEILSSEEDSGETTANADEEAAGDDESTVDSQVDHSAELAAAIQAANRKVATKEDLSRFVDNSPPVKLTESGQIDWDKYDHVYYYHTRKAGGTTLVKWVRLMAWKHGKNFTKDEGPVFDHEMFKDNDRVLLVTSLRPPSDRVISSYNFDLNQVGVEMTVPEFVQDAHKYNTKKHTQFIKWENRRRGWIWKCASECYTKWFGGWPTAEFVPNAEKAAETLNNFEIIWMKNLKNQKYMDWLTYRFNDTNPIPHKRKTSKAKPKISEDDMALLDSVNRNDIELYNVLRGKWQHIVPLDNSTFI